METDAGWECMCAPGFIGLTCQDVPTSCDPDPCRNNADCFVDALGKL